MSYRWVCPSCSESNDGKYEVCQSCGCPSVASAEQVERYKYPEMYKNKMVSKDIEWAWSFVVVIPAWILASIYNGSVIGVLILCLVAGCAIYIKRNLLVSLVMDKWVRSLILIFTTPLFALLAFRLWFADSASADVLVPIVLIGLIWCVSFFIYLKTDGRLERMVNIVKKNAK